MPAALPAAPLRQVFRRRGRWSLSCPVDRLPRRLGTSIEDAADRLVDWIRAGLVELWTDPSGAGSIAPTPALRAMLGAWEDDPGPRAKRRSVAFSDLAGGLGPDDFPSAWPDHAEAVLAALDPPRKGPRPIGPPGGRLLPVAGCCRPWGPPEIERHRLARKRGSTPPPCPECDGLALAGAGLCLVCERAGRDRPGETAEAPLPGRTAYRPDGELAGGRR